jgi:hypothetical protein
LAAWEVVDIASSFAAVGPTEAGVVEYECEDARARARTRLILEAWACASWKAGPGAEATDVVGSREGGTCPWAAFQA